MVTPGRLEVLRRDHPRFWYRGYEVDRDGSSLRFRFAFEIEPGIRFAPEVVLSDVDRRRVDELGRGVLDNLAFHLGLIEIPSYWKATCAPRIVVEAGYLDQDQRDWWQKLLIDGMGEFFFVNEIDFTAPDFVRFELGSDVRSHGRLREGREGNGSTLVPIGGGKDSALACEILKQTDRHLACWTVNPSLGTEQVIAASGIPKTYRVKRTIDPTLLRLNDEGYLNGHTPFSACLAFLAVTHALATGAGAVAVSNESSSNEGNVRYLDREINHQYTKTFAFERDFQEYVSRYVTTGVRYFSLLRPLHEIQIARAFARYDQYSPVFRSCNRGQKTNSWCGNCPKCLFAFIITYPFLSARDLAAIFPGNLLCREENVDVAFGLLGRDRAKSFECVGTTEETLVAFHLCARKAAASGEPAPVVLRAVQEQALDQERGMPERAAALLRSWDENHAIPSELEPLVRALVDERS